MSLTGQKQFERKLNAIGKVSENKKLWGRIGFQAIDIISQRTLKGKDYKGALFAAYSTKPSYFKTKGKYRLFEDGYKGYKASRGISNVNLDNTGNMFSSLKAKSTNRNTTLFFSKPLEAKKAAIHHKGLGKQKKREFFNLSSREQDDLMDLMRKELKRAISG